MEKLEVFKTLETFFPQGCNRLIEIRAINPNSKADIWSGYFYDYDEVWNAIQRFDATYNLYVVLNEIDSRCNAMSQMGRMLKGVTTTQDKDIVSREWVLLDIDTEKNHLSISSTNAEWQSARMKAHEVRNYLLGLGFSEPVVCSSGNGLHLLFKVDKWGNTEGNNIIVERFLKSLSAMFSDEKAEVDVKVGNPARITKLYGTIAKKGLSTAERPHRLSKLLLVPTEIRTTDIAYFEKVAKMLPVDERVSTSTYNLRNGGKFDIDEFIREHNIGVAKDTTINGIRKIVLAECPFNPAHTAPDSAVFVMPNGSLGFACFHASCDNYTFKDFRLHYDPNAYDKKDYYEYESKRRFYTPYQAPPSKPIVQTQEKGSIWLKLGSITKPSFSYSDFIPSGLEEIDKRGIGFRRGQVSIWTGKRGCGKSSILNMLILNAAQRNYKSALWTGELTSDMVKEWLFLQAAGVQHTERIYGTDYFKVHDNVSNRIGVWIDKYLWLFNNKYGENFSQIEEQIKLLHKQECIDMVLLDNLMVLDIRTLEENKYDRQAVLLQRLQDLAKELNIHIHLVAHPHKSLGYIQVDNIGGSGDVPNKADNIFVMSRINRDFLHSAKEYLGDLKYQEIVDSGCSNIIEIGKFRTKGTLVGSVLKLWFEESTNRLKNSITENVVYAWAEPPAQASFAFDNTQQTQAESDYPFPPPGNDEEAPF